MTAVLRHRGARAGAALGLLVLAAAALGPLAVGHDPDLPDYANQLAAPSAGHWLGTDHAGRDQLARTLAGARTSLAAVAVVLGLTTAIGLVVGGVAGYLGGVVDAVVARLIDAVLGLPSQIVALAVVGALGVGADHLVLALVAGGWAYLARIARAAALGARHRPYVVAARLAGIPSWRILAGHLLPTTVGTVLAAATTGVGEIVLTLAGLSFLGLGAQPPTAELGQLLADSQGSLTSAPWLLVGPLAVIAATVGASMLLSDALRDTLDPAPPRRRTRAPGRRRVARAPRPRGAAPAAPAAVEAAPAAARRGAVLALDNLTVTYPDGTVAVANVSLAVAPGERLALVGESGCGKTTIARTVLDLLPPGATAAGAVRVAGTAPGGAPEALRGRLVGYVAQDPYAACDPVRSVRHHVAEAWRAHRRRPPAGEVTRRVAALGVPDAARRLRQRPHQWSGGMLQRATIAASTAHQPAITIADEPTSALDADLADEVLHALRHTGRALLLISHDLRLVADHTDRIAVMYAGRIVEAGPTATVVTRPRHPYTRALLAAATTAPPAAPTAPDGADPDPTRPGTRAPGCAYALRCDAATDRCAVTAPPLTNGVACWHAAT